jgi:hypothetical protein
MFNDIQNEWWRFPRAWLAMFVLSTTENFPFIMYPALFRVGGGLATNVYGIYTVSYSKNNVLI